MSSLADILIAEVSKKNSPLQQKATIPGKSRCSQAVTVHATDVAIEKSSTSDPHAESHKQPEETKSIQTTEPLAPPPRPSQPGASEGDYFSSNHGTGSGSHFALEPNPFDKSFGAQDQTPGGTLLPPVASLTSPALPGSNNTGGYTWPNSLRSGPLSPAMLAGPAGSGDYFTDGLSRGFPTPNESSLRTGLTPGGGGSMFPAPSPNSQAIYQQLQSGGATPSTLDFHRTALNAAARNKPAPFTSNPQEGSQHTSTNMDQSVHGDATDAANGLFMLAKGGQNGNFAVPGQPQAIQSKAPTNAQDQNVMDKRASRNGNSIGSYSGPEISGAGSDSHEETKPATRGKGKKNAKSQPQSTGRRKADDTPQKGSNKKSKGNQGQPNNVDPNLEPISHLEDDDDSVDDELPQDGKKMTDEEKRKNFLERNRLVILLKTSGIGS